MGGAGLRAAQEWLQRVQVKMVGIMQSVDYD